MVEQGGDENACNDGVTLFKTGSKKQGQELGLVADLGNGDGCGGA
jgi:hypothetical protein